jgi:hypothetical protein
MTIVFVTCAVGGLLILLVGPDHQRPLGLATLIMFGGGGFGWWFREFRTDRAAAPRLRSVTLPSGLSSPALVLPIKSGTALFLALTLVAFAVGSAIMLVFPPDRQRGGLILVVAIVVLLVGVWRVMRGARRKDLFVALAPGGVLVEGLDGTAFMPWPAIINLSEFEIYGQPYLGIDLSSPRFIEGNAGRGAYDRVGRLLTRHHQAIHLRQFAVPAERVAALVREYHEHPERRPGLGRDPAAVEPLRASIQPMAAISAEERRHARSVGRWFGVLLLVISGTYVTAFALAAGAELLPRALDRPAETGPVGSFAGLVLAWLMFGAVLILGLLHYGAAFGIARHRETGRSTGIVLSVVGTSLSLAGALAIVVFSGRLEPAASVLAGFFGGGYFLCLVLLLVVGDLRRLKVAPSTPL